MFCIFINKISICKIHKKKKTRRHRSVIRAAYIVAPWRGMSRKSKTKSVGNTSCPQ